MRRTPLLTTCGICDQTFPSAINTWGEINTNSGEIWWEACPRCGTEYEIRMSFSIVPDPGWRRRPQPIPTQPRALHPKAPKHYQGRPVEDRDILDRYNEPGGPE